MEKSIWQLIKNQERNRAIKKIKLKKLRQIKNFKNEVYALKSLDHPNIIKLYEIYHDEKHAYLVMELWTGGELISNIRK